MEEAHELRGGVANRGRVVRIGDTVRRPAGPHAAAVHALLAHLATSAFDGAPVPLGEDDEGRHVYAWIEGDVPIPPFPPWADTDQALLTTARLMRQLHDAAASFTPPAGASWARDLADPHGGPIVCHNDICPENVVFREGVAVALLDFDFAAPGRPIWDLAAAARMWAPLWPPAPDFPRTEHDTARRLACLAQGYRLPGEHHEELIDAIFESERVGASFLRRRVDAAEPAFVELWHERGGKRGIDGRRAWMESQRQSWLDALRTSEEPA